ncbi:MAG: hypothetical protein R6V40_02160, partial [Candidatus Moraniibacteriota bacterium]
MSKTMPNQEKFNPFDQQKKEQEPKEDRSEMTPEEEQEVKRMAGVVDPLEHAERMINSGDEKLEEEGKKPKREIEKSMEQQEKQKPPEESRYEHKEEFNAIETGKKILRRAEAERDLESARTTAEG